ncbi:ABC transporter ATP-binding protein [Catellatospora sp. NPDC049133]|uniref:ABC transporter ATP-binding protein n=1 Tax=Catellatospora sp. NPDC049133 TaxID=3155499 RepID=UPI0033E8EE3A
MRDRVLTTDGRRLLRHGLHGSRTPMLRIAAWSVLEAAPALAAGWITAQALDRGFLTGRPLDGLLWLAALGALYLVRAFAERAMFPHLAQIVEPLRDALVRRLVDATLRQAAAGRPADAAAVSRLTRQAESVRDLSAALLRTARPLTVTLLAAMGGLVALTPTAAALVLPPFLLALAAYPLALGALQRRRMRLLLAEEQLAAQTGTVLVAARDIVALAAEPHAVATVDTAARDYARITAKVALAGSARSLLVLLGGYAPLLVLLIAGPRLVAAGALSAGALVGAATYVTGYLLPALQMLTGMVGGLWAQLGVTLTRLAQVSAPPPAAAATTAVPAGQELTVDRLTFAYGPHAAPVIRDLSLTVAPGEHLAIVGASGIGKSTLADLLAGLQMPGRGDVRLGGVPVRELDEPTRCAAIALVPQEAYVFAGTVRENLCYLNPWATTADLDHSVAQLGLAELIDRLGGYDGQLTDPGTELSNGERQLLVLGRVHVSAARVVILDEATCHLDPAAEAQAERAFAGRAGTLVVIAHRIASARRARRILLLDGACAHLGSHEQLLESSPTYADLVGRWAPEPAAAGRAVAGAAVS